MDIVSGPAGPHNLLAYKDLRLGRDKQPSAAIRPAPSPPVQGGTQQAQVGLGPTGIETNLPWRWSDHEQGKLCPTSRFKSNLVVD